MKFPNFEIDENIIIEIARNYQVSELYLFGSVLTNNFNNQSDIDFLVSFSSKSNISLFDLQELKNKLSTLLHRNVDLIEKEGLTNPYRKQAILSSARKIYGH